MKRVLLTGAGGFIGRHCLLPLAARGYEVHAVTTLGVNTSSGIKDQPGVTWHSADLLDSGQVSSLVAETAPTHLLHLAWYAVPGKFWTTTENLRWVRASLELFEVFAAAGGRRVVAAGTCAEYDWSHLGADGLCSEVATPLRPATLYGACKLATGTVLEALARQVGISAAWGRVFFLYGPHEHPDRFVAAVVRALLKGDEARCTHGQQVRDLLYVADVADAFVALLDAEIVGAVNIASGRGVALGDVATEIAWQLGREDRLRLGALPTRPDEPSALVGDARRLRDEVRWQPRLDLAAGLRETIEWWRGELTNPD